MLKKLKNNDGITVVFSLCVFLVVCILSAIMVSGALSAVKNTSSQQKDEQLYLNATSASSLFLNKTLSNEIDRHIDYVYITEPGGSTPLNFASLLPSEYIYDDTDISTFENTLEEYGIEISNNTAVYNISEEDNPIYTTIKNLLVNNLTDIDYDTSIIDFSVNNDAYANKFVPIKFKMTMDDDYTLKINTNEDTDKYNTSFVLNCVPVMKYVNVNIPYTYIVYVNKDDEEREENAEPELVPEYRTSVLTRTINIREFRWSLETVQKGKGGVFS